MSDRATIFGSEAEEYDRYRPGYPAAAIDVVLERSPHDAIDIGCGTGKVARLLADRGVSVVGVEPDARMAEIARRHGIEVSVSTIEDWQPTPCDLMLAAQSWHWVDPTQGGTIAAMSVRPGGRWAAMWNYERDAIFTAARHEVYDRLAPDLLDDERRSDESGFRDDVAGGLAATTKFDDLVITDIPWSDRITVADAVKRLASHSAHRLLPAERARAVADGLVEALGQPGDELTLDYTTRVFHADRRD